MKSKNTLKFRYEGIWRKGCAWILAFVMSFTTLLSSLTPSLAAAGDTFDINRSVSRRFTGESFVLLRNNGDILPIQTGNKIAVFGSTQVNTQMTVFGSGSTSGIGVSFVDTLSAMKTAGISVDSDLETRYRNFARTNPPDTGMYNVDNEILSQRSIPEMPLTDAIVSAAAQKNDKAVIFIGRTNGEGYDWKLENEYQLRAEEKQMIDLVIKYFDKVSVILNTASPIDMTWDSDKIDSILWVGIVGAQGANAIADVLSGTVNPSGKLTQTWAGKYTDTPTHKNYEMTNWPAEILGPELTYEEDIYAGYRYYDTFNVTPKFHFGFGLSYTTFDTVISSVEASANTVTVRATVKNTGNIPGKEVVQVYFSAPGGRLEKAYQELAGFGKTGFLRPGEKQTLTITYRTGDMASYEEASAQYILEQGDYIIRAGNSSRSTHVGAVVSLDNPAVTEQLSNQMTEAIPLDRFSRSGHTPYTYDGEAEEIENAPRIELHAADIITEYNASAISDEPALLDGSVEADFVQAARQELILSCLAPYAEPSDAGRQIPGKIYCADLGINFAGYVLNDPSGDADGYKSVTVQNANTQMPFDVASVYDGKHALTLRYFIKNASSVSVLNQNNQTLCTFQLTESGRWADTTVNGIDLTGITQMKLVIHNDNVNLNWLSVQSQQYTGLVKATLPQGSYSEPVSVALYNSDMPDAEIHYTTDGSEPTESSPVYGQPLSVTGNVTIKAMAVKQGFNNSKTITLDYKIDSSITAKAAKPSASFAGRDEQQNQRLVLSAAAGMSIFYTLDGSMPTTASNYYNGPVSVANGTTVRAIAAAAGYVSSDVATVRIAAVDAPAAGLETSGTYLKNQMMTLSSGSNTTIYYTMSTDGTQPPDPTTASAIYKGAITFDAIGKTIVKAFAADAGGTSETSVFVYNIVEKLLTLEDVYNADATVEQVVAQMTLSELAEVTANAGRSSRFLSPQVAYADGPLGVKTPNFTQWAAPSLLACSWDVSLFAEQGDAVGKEQVETGIDFWLAPGLNILRDPRSGRNAEYYAEDETLTGILASAVISNVQKHGVGCVLKHYVGNDQETNRKQNANAVVSERALREIYLKAFEIAVKTSQPWGLMTTYCDVNRISTATNFALCTAIPRGEWGYKGIIMTDWICYADNGMMMYAGNDLVMPSGSANVMINAVLNPSSVNKNDPNYTKPTTKAMLQRNVAAVFHTMVRTNAFARSIGKAQTYQYQAPSLQWMSSSAGASTTNVWATSGGNGAVTPAQQEVIVGGNAVFSAVPDEGYAVDSVAIQPKTEYVLAGGQLTLLNVQPATSMHITFRKIPAAPDFEELNRVIADARQFLSGVTIGGQVGNYLRTSAEEFQTTIDAAITIADNNQATVTQVEDAITVLKQAMAAFESKAVTQTTHEIRDGRINKIKAVEHSDASAVVKSEICNDSDGGYNTTGTYKGVFLEYALDVADTNLYSLCGRISTNENGCGYEVYVDGILQGTVVQALKTGGWQNWQISDPLKVQLNKGTHTLRIVFIKSGINVNYFTLEPLMKTVTAGTDGHGAVTPGSMQVEMGTNAAFELIPHEGYMPSSVTISPKTDFVLSRNSLTVSRIMSDTSVSVQFRQVPATPDLARLNQVINTAQAKADAAVPNGKAGNYTPRIIALFTNNIGQARQAASDDTLSALDIEYAIVALEQAIQTFDNSRLQADVRMITPAGIHNIKATSHSATYSTGLAIGSEPCQDTDGGRNPIYTDGGTWLAYTIEVEKSGEYQFTPRVSVNTAGAGFVVELDDKQVATYTGLTATGGWQNWVSKDSSSIYLPEGIHTLKIAFVQSGMNINWFELQAINITTLHHPDAVTAEYGTAFEALNLPDAVKVTLSNNETRYIPVAWDSQSYNGTAAGDYQLTGTLQDTSGINNFNGLTASITVTVSEKTAGQLNLNQLKQAIEAAERVEDKVVPAEMAALFQQALKDARDLAADAESGETEISQQDIDNAADALTAITDTVVNYSFRATIEFAVLPELEGIDINLYIPKTTLGFKNALDALEIGFEDPSATDEQLQILVDAAYAAKDRMVLKTDTLTEILDGEGNVVENPLFEANAPFTVSATTPDTAVFVRLVNENGMTIGKTIVSVTDNGDGTKTWVMTASVATSGEGRILDIYTAGSDKEYTPTGSSIGFSILSPEPAMLSAVKTTAGSANVNEEFTITVETTKTIDKVKLTNETGASIGIISKSFVIDGNKKRWTLTAKIGTKGDRIVTVYGAPKDADYLEAGVSFNVTILKP